jgi:hypothetical protein
LTTSFNATPFACNKCRSNDEERPIYIALANTDQVSGLLWLPVHQRLQRRGGNVDVRRVHHDELDVACAVRAA